MIKIKALWEKISFKTKIGLLFCGLFLILPVINLVLPSTELFPLSSISVLVFGVLLILSSIVFGCNFKAPTDAIGCNLALVLSTLIWLLIFFGVGWIIGWIIEKINAKMLEN